VVLIESRHEESHLVTSDIEADVFQTMDQVLDASCTSASIIEDAEGIDEIKVCLERELNLNFFAVVLKFELVLEDEENMTVGTAQTR